MNEPPEKRRWKKPPKAPGEGRGLSETVHDQKKKRSSREWIERQINDPYVRRTQLEGWRARSAFKLIELDEKFDILKPRQRIVDLGAAPGGWTQVALKRGAGPVVGIDLLPVEPLAGAEFIEMDFLNDAAPDVLMMALGGRPDLVLSDMAANTTGHRATDQIKTGALAEAAAHFAMDVLAPGGTFVTKAFQGGLEASLLGELKQRFESVRHAKPPASRTESPEIYVVAKGFRG